MNEQITDRETQKRLHTKFHTMDIMRSEARPIKQSISRACRNHAFGIHESRHIYAADERPSTWITRAVQPLKIRESERSP